MAIESYTDSIKPWLTERAERLEKTREAASMLHLLIRNHTVFPDDGSSQIVPSYWDEQNPEELVWFDLQNHNGEPIEQSYFDSLEEEERWTAAGKADLVFSTVRIPAMTVFTIDFLNERIRDSEGNLLTSREINGVIYDIGRYTAAIAAGRTD